MQVLVLKFSEKKMITFRIELSIFITESDNDHFSVMITFEPLLKSNEAITGPLPSIVIITGVITNHYLTSNGFRK